MSTAVAPEVGIDIAIPERLLIATADALPGWLRQETQGSPRVPSYAVREQERGFWEFRAGRGYFELDYLPANRAGQRDAIEIVVRVINGTVYAGIREVHIPVAAHVLGVVQQINANTGGLLRTAMLDQLHAHAEGKGRGMKTIDIRRTRQLIELLPERVS